MDTVFKVMSVFCFFLAVFACFGVSMVFRVAKDLEYSVSALEDRLDAGCEHECLFPDGFFVDVPADSDPGDLPVLDVDGLDDVVADSVPNFDDVIVPDGASLCGQCSGCGEYHFVWDVEEHYHDHSHLNDDDICVVCPPLRPDNCVCLFYEVL